MVKILWILTMIFFVFLGPANLVAGVLTAGGGRHLGKNNTKQ